MEWESSIPSELQGSDYFARLQGKELGDVLKSGYEASNFAAGAMKIPGPDSAEDVWDSFYSKTRPTTAADYSMELDKEMGWEGTALDKFKETAHKYGISSKQLQGLLNEGYAPIAKAAVAEQEAEVLSAERLAKTELGEKYQGKLNDTERLFKRMDNEDVFTAIKNTSLIHNTKALEVFSQMANMFDEDTLVGGNETRWQSSADITAEIARRRNDPGDPLNNNSHPEHRQAVKDLNMLYQRAQAVKS